MIANEKIRGVVVEADCDACDGSGLSHAKDVHDEPIRCAICEGRKTWRRSIPLVQFKALVAS